MFSDLSTLVARSELHRRELMAEAENYRLARLASSLRRRRPRVTTQPADPPEPPRNDAGHSAAPSESASQSADREHDADRRYAVSR
jgi:hypothetical protein